MKRLIIETKSKFNFDEDILLKIICERYPNTNFYFFASSKYKDLKGIKTDNLNIIYENRKNNSFYSKIKNKFKALKRQNDYTCNKIDGILQVDEIDVDEKLLINSSHNFLLGININSLISEKRKQYLNDKFKHYLDVCFDNKNSYQIFQNLENVRFAKDMVSTLEISEIEDKNFTVITVMFPSKIDKFKLIEAEYFNRLKVIIESFIDRGENIKLLSISDENDMSIQKLLNMIPNIYHKNINLYFYKGDINKILELLKNSKRIITHSYRVMLIGIILKKIVFPIIIDENIKIKLDDIKFNQNYTFLKNLNNFTVEKIEENKPLLINKILKLIRDGQRNFIELDRFIDEKKRG